MKDKKAKVLAYLFLLLFIVSLTQTYFLKEHTVAYFYDTITSSVFLAATALYMFAIYKSENVKQADFCTIILMMCYYLNFHTIYSSYIADNYLLAFLWAKEFLIIFVLFASYTLFLTLDKDRQKFNLRGMILLTFCALAVFCFVSILVDKVVNLQLGIYLFFASMVPVILNSYIIKHKKPSTRKKVHHTKKTD